MSFASSCECIDLSRALLETYAHRVQLVAPGTLANFPRLSNTRGVEQSLVSFIPLAIRITSRFARNLLARLAARGLAYSFLVVTSVAGDAAGEPGLRADLSRGTVCAGRCGNGTSRGACLSRLAFFAHCRSLRAIVVTISSCWTAFAGVDRSGGSRGCNHRIILCSRVADLAPRETLDVGEASPAARFGPCAADDVHVASLGGRRARGDPRRI